MGEAREYDRSSVVRLSFHHSKYLVIQHEHSASVWAVMERFGQVLIAEELNGPAIYCLENVMTMHVDKHDIFNALGLWLERTVSQLPRGYKEEN